MDETLQWHTKKRLILSVLQHQLTVNVFNRNDKHFNPKQDNNDDDDRDFNLTKFVDCMCVYVIMSY